MNMNITSMIPRPKNPSVVTLALVTILVAIVGVSLINELFTTNGGRLFNAERFILIISNPPTTK